TVCMCLCVTLRASGVCVCVCACVRVGVCVWVCACLRVKKKTNKRHEKKERGEKKTTRFVLTWHAMLNPFTVKELSVPRVNVMITQSSEESKPLRASSALPVLLLLVF